MDEFEKSIKEYLDSIEDETFKNKYDPARIKKCCEYIVSQVKKSGRCGFADNEIYKFARDFYDDEIQDKDIESANCNVVVNRTIELSEKEKNELKEEAKEQYKNEQLALLKKEQEKQQVKVEKEKKKIESTGQASFDLGI